MSQYPGKQVESDWHRGVNSQQAEEDFPHVGRGGFGLSSAAVQLGFPFLCFTSGAAGGIRRPDNTRIVKEIVKEVNVQMRQIRSSDIFRADAPPQRKGVRSSAATLKKAQVLSKQ